MGTSRHFGEHHDEIIETFELLRDTWSAVDPNSKVARYPASYHETFLDMARAVVEKRYAALPAREPVTEDELAQVVLDSRMSRMGNNPRSLARAILSEFDVTKKGQA